MEAVLMKSTGDNKHRFGNPNRNFYANRTLFPYPSDNLLYTSFLAGGGFSSMPPAVPPPSLSHSVFRPPLNLHHYRQQPPLLPLPISTPVNHPNTNIARCNSYSNTNIRLSPPQNNRNNKNRVRDHSLTPKKSKNQKKESKKQVVDLVPPVTTEETEAPPPKKYSTESTIADVIVPDPRKTQKKESKKQVVDLVHPVTTEETKASPPEKRLTEPSIDDVTGPDPKDLPKEAVLARVFSSSVNKSCDIDVDKFSGTVMFTPPSPPPSSLPLPTFFLRSKVSCKAEASGVDVGATDGLRRLLRL